MPHSVTKSNLPNVSHEPAYVDVAVDNDGAIQHLAVHPALERIAQLLWVRDRFLRHVHPDEQEFVRTNIDWAFAQASRNAHIQFRLARPDGRWSNVMAHIRQVNAGSLQILMQPNDIAYARNAESQLRRVVEESLQGIVVISNGQTLYCNEGYARMLGFVSAREFAASDPSKTGDFIHPDDRQMVHDRLARLEPTSRFEFRLLRLDGMTIWAHVTATPVEWDGKPALLSWLTDISDRKRAEEELRGSKEAAEFANRSKTEFLANMSHELRTPLNAILGFSEVIREQMMGPLGSPKYVEYAGDIHKSGEHLLDLINDVLDLAKIDARKLDLRECEFAPADIVADCMSLLSARAESDAVSLTAQVTHDAPLLRADKRAVKQVLLNLLSNAIKFTPRGGRVSITGRVSADRTFGLSVTDNGIGMSAPEIEVAMAPFGQVDSKFTRQQIGTGLGLPVSRSLMRLHGGDVIVSSVPGAGTTMTAVFPPERVLAGLT